MDTKILLENGTNELEILEFTIGKFSYGINVAKIKEIIPYIIIIIVVINAILSFIQEKKADVAIEELNNRYIDVEEIHIDIICIFVIIRKDFFAMRYDLPRRTDDASLSRTSRRSNIPLSAAPVRRA